MNVFEFLQTIPGLKETATKSRVYTRFPDKPQTEIFAVVEFENERTREAFYGAKRPKVTGRTICIHLFDPAKDATPERITNVQNDIMHGNETVLPTPILSIEESVDADLTPGIAIGGCLFFVNAIGPRASTRVNALHVKLDYEIRVQR
jgi:hypothetical protein